jgi:D-alanyl-lipoteichoic acid acyltransferase DltB (MBOAT superfamily)
LFVSFFPQLLAGPIGRGKNLIPQFYQIHKFNTNYFTEGARLILWGYFMKVVVSDRLATYVDSVFNNIAQHNSSSLIVASVFFSFQIYCDFGGYSNIAIGCAKIMGFDLMTNFRRPYMAASVTDFWRRWHISLSTWFRDYLYIPLGGNRCSKKRNYFNLMVTFVVSGLWHGASWTFVIWGGINGLFQILIDKTFKNTRNRIQSFLRMDRYRTVVYYLNVLFTFILITIAWVFFKARTLSDAFLLFDRVLSHHGPLFTVPMQALMYGSIFSIVLIVSDFIQEKNDGKHFFLENERAIVRYISYLLIVILILMFGVFDGSQFIYFQF